MTPTQPPSERVKKPLKQKMLEHVENAWYGDSSWSQVFKPLEALYAHTALKAKVKGQLSTDNNPLGIPVIIVGNITAGGTGKSPVVSCLVEFLAAKGYRPGILSRGYGAKTENRPHLVSADDSPDLVGDEPLMLALNQPNIPVVIDRDRLRGARFLKNESQVDIIICDDGLQHYGLPRDIELVVLDAKRGIGNGCLIPVGPLREPLERLDNVDYVLSNGAKEQLQEEVLTKVDWDFEVKAKQWRKVATGEVFSLEQTQELLQGVSDEPKDKTVVYAVSGIGNPSRFYKTLEALGLNPEPVSFPDHHSFQAEDFRFLAKDDNSIIVMTAKDAVKCRGFAAPSWLSLEVKAKLPQEFLDSILAKVKLIEQKKESNRIRGPI